jgi:hypothetical protein
MVEPFLQQIDQVIAARRLEIAIGEDVIVALLLLYLM